MLCQSSDTMKKIRSRKLFEYLLSCGVLSLGDEAITRAKQEYRKRYKREHKRNKKQKEVRPLFTQVEYLKLCQRATLYGLSPTGYVKEIVIQQLTGGEIIPCRDELLCVLQKVSMALNQKPSPEMMELLVEAEQMLLKYLSHDCKNTNPTQSFL